MGAYQVLVVDDDAASRSALAEVVRTLGAACAEAASAEQALSLFAGRPYDVVVTDLMLPGLSGLDLVRRLRARAPAPAVVLVTGHAALDTAVEALKEGASDYLSKPVDAAALRSLVESLLARRPPASLEGESELPRIVSFSRAMRGAIEALSKVAEDDAPVLLLGESGAGKELCASWVHGHSRRRAGPFVPLHAGDLPPDQTAAFLIGGLGRPGRLELALGGTLFLDDADRLDPAAQETLARVLDEGALTLADGRRARFDVRLVAASSRVPVTPADRPAHGDSGLDRLLSRRIVRIPALRQRLEDLAPLAQRFAALFAEQYRKPGARLSPEALQALTRHSWPGNVRELRNAVEQAVILARGPVLGAELLPLPPADPADADFLRIPVGTSLREVERQMILRTLERNRGNKNLTARQLGMSRRSLYNKLDRYRVPQPPEIPAGDG